MPVRFVRDGEKGNADAVRDAVRDTVGQSFGERDAG
jgi:hypothetical protein